MRNNLQVCTWINPGDGFTKLDHRRKLACTYCNGEFPLSTWWDLEYPRRHTSGCAPEFSESFHWEGKDPRYTLMPGVEHPSLCFPTEDAVWPTASCSHGSHYRPHPHPMECSLQTVTSPSRQNKIKHPPSKPNKPVSHGKMPITSVEMDLTPQRVQVEPVLFKLLLGTEGVSFRGSTQP